ncbi:MAG: hypothetical protein ABIA93_01185 [Candidatus Woesearchaeota archaeon]
MNVRLLVLVFLLFSLIQVASAEVKEVQGMFNREQVLIENSHQIYVIGDSRMDVEVTKIDVEHKVVHMIINGKQEVFEFGDSAQIQYNLPGVRMMLYSHRLLPENPLASFAFMQSFSGLSSSTLGQQLHMSQFPNAFGLDNGFALVVGEKAEADKVVAGIELLKIVGIIDHTSPVTNRVTGETHDIPIIPIGRVMLDNDAEIGTGNFLIVGGPCANKIASDILGNPADCTSGFEDGKALIQLFDRNGFNALLVAGFSAYDTQRAVEFLWSNTPMDADRIVINTSTLEVVETS